MIRRERRGDPFNVFKSIHMSGRCFNCLGFRTKENIPASSFKSGRLISGRRLDDGWRTAGRRLCCGGTSRTCFPSPPTVQLRRREEGQNSLGDSCTFEAFKPRRSLREEHQPQPELRCWYLAGVEKRNCFSCFAYWLKQTGY